jgi:nucleotide-binding universal stress UspA family protein
LASGLQSVIVFDTVVIATDGSESAERAVAVALDLARRFDAAVHALYVIDAGEVAATPEEVRDELERALTTTGGEALSFVCDAADAEASGDDVVTAVREGDPVAEICRYADEQDADVVVTGTRGRHGHGFVLGSVAEGVIRRSEAPLLRRSPEQYLREQFYYGLQPLARPSDGAYLEHLFERATDVDESAEPTDFLKRVEDVPQYVLYV